MKTIQSKNQNLTVEEQIHTALKRKYLYAESVVDGQFYNVGNKKEEVQINWENSGLDHIKIITSDGPCFVSYTLKPRKDAE